MSDLRKELLRQMAAIRRTIDPKVLERARLAVEGKVPVDQDVTRRAVASFLDARNDGGAFRRRLEQELRREGAALDLESADRKPADRSDSTHPLKPRRIGRIA